MGDLFILLIENEKIAGTLRGALGHKAEKAFHGFAILENLLCLSVHFCPSVLTFSLLHGSGFFLGILLFRLWLGFLLFADQTG